MKYLRAAAIGLFVAAIGLFVVSKVQVNMKTDPSRPVITCDADEIEVSVEYTEEQLREGVHAEDAEDGDLTDEIIVGEISQFIDTGVSYVSYVVFDSANQPAVCSRKVRFIDYESPKFGLTAPLVFRAGDINNAMNLIVARDVLDGDITSSVLNTNDDISYQIPGTYTIEIEVTNSYGDMQNAALPVHVVDSHINLLGNNNPLVYIECGEPLDASALTKGLFVSKMENATPQEVTVESNVDVKTPGIYEVHFSCAQGETWTTVIVR